jgi:hypothetical protein
MKRQWQRILLTCDVKSQDKERIPKKGEERRGEGREKQEERDRGEEGKGSGGGERDRERDGER